jgi:very-short-patch-repair endonuclease
MNCIYCQKEYPSAFGQRSHQTFCKENPNRKLSPFVKLHADQKAGTVPKAIPWNKNKTKADDCRISSCGHQGPLSEEHKELISSSMKVAHAEGRAWNIGQSRWNNEPSYPEQFFMQVIENEFEDKAYVREYPFGRFSLDFAWPHKKVCIEIDGEQHQQFPEYAERDARKTKALTDAGWQVLRIVWKDMYSDPKTWIAKAKDFIPQ